MTDQDYLLPWERTIAESDRLAYVKAAIGSAIVYGALIIMAVCMFA